MRCLSLILQSGIASESIGMHHAIYMITSNDIEFVALLYLVLAAIKLIGMVYKLVATWRADNRHIGYLVIHIQDLVRLIKVLPKGHRDMQINVLICKKAIAITQD